MVMAGTMSMLLWLGGCEGVPAGHLQSPSEMKVLDVLDPDFVRFEDERMPVDEFLFRMRQLGRHFAETGKPLFGIRIVVSGRPVDQKLLDRIMDDLRLSGVQHVILGEA